MLRCVVLRGADDADDSQLPPSPRDHLSDRVARRPQCTREKIVDEGKARYAAALKRIAAANGGPLSDDDKRIRDMWGSEGTPSRLLDAVDEIRFQLGQSDRFRAGLVRSGAAGAPANARENPTLRAPGWPATKHRAPGDSS